jgi:hypothetical protein
VRPIPAHAALVEVRRVLATQRECLKLLDAKIGHYSSRLAELETANL